MDKDVTRRRLPRQERERLIVDTAVQFFAEYGLDGQTRALAQRLGVTQPLLYRYFPDKDALIARVYEEIMLGGWDASWTDIVADRSRPLADRLVDVYRAYAALNFGYDRVRLFTYAGLRDEPVATRYLAFLRERLFVPVARELREETGLPADVAPGETEVECVAGLHGSLAFLALRQWVFRTPVPEDLAVMIDCLVRTFVAGALITFRELAVDGCRA